MQGGGLGAHVGRWFTCAHAATQVDSVTTLYVCSLLMYGPLAQPDHLLWTQEASAMAGCQVDGWQTPFSWGDSYPSVPISLPLVLPPSALPLSPPSF